MALPEVHNHTPFTFAPLFVLDDRGRLVITPPHYTITPVNAYDDGTLNDRPDPLAMPRAVVEWIEFEAPVVDVWPPEHHTRVLFASPLRASNSCSRRLRRFALPRGR